MKFHSTEKPASLALLSVCLLVAFGCARAIAQPIRSQDWPRWGGPRRDFKSDSTGLARRWPAGGPQRLWSRPLGEGHSAIVAEGGRLYTMYRKGQQEVVISLDAKTGRTIWEYGYAAHSRSQKHNGSEIVRIMLNKRLPWLLAILSLILVWPEVEAQDLSKYFQNTQGAFVLYDLKNDRYLRYNERRCSERFNPFSTFKIPNSLIGLETGVIKDAEFVIRLGDGKNIGWFVGYLETKGNVYFFAINLDEKNGAGLRQRRINLTK